MVLLDQALKHKDDGHEHEDDGFLSAHCCTPSLSAVHLASKIKRIAGGTFPEQSLPFDVRSLNNLCHSMSTAP